MAYCYSTYPDHDWNFTFRCISISYHSIWFERIKYTSMSIISYFFELGNNGRCYEWMYVMSVIFFLPQLTSSYLSACRSVRLFAASQSPMISEVVVRANGVCVTTSLCGYELPVSYQILDTTKTTATTIIIAMVYGSVDTLALLLLLLVLW